MKNGYPIIEKALTQVKQGLEDVAERCIDYIGSFVQFFDGDNRD